MRTFALVSCLVLTSSFIACSSGSGSAGGGSLSSPSTCEEVCAKALELSCPNETLESCTADCKADYSTYESAGCSSQSGSMLGCIETKATFHCGTNGQASVDSTLLLDACKSETIALAGCAACVQDANDDPCDICEKTSCCSEWKAALSDPAVIDASLCMQDCQDSACANACLAKYPSAQTKMTAMSECKNSKCSSSC